MHDVLLRIYGTYISYDQPAASKRYICVDSIHHKAKQTSPKPTSEHLMLTSPSSHRASNM